MGIFKGKITESIKGNICSNQQIYFIYYFSRCPSGPLEFSSLCFCSVPHVNYEKKANIMKMFAICLATLEKLPICVANQNSL